MTSPRSHLVDPKAAGFYHCMSRCVRRAFLCGVDVSTGQSYEHRKQWVEDRLLELADIFAVGIYAYAVMSNHLHVVVYIDPSATVAWSPDEVARRWVRLTPVRVDGEVDETACDVRATALAGNAERVAALRERLGSLSWFMRFLNEPIARRANREDGCTGHFWEARFKCQALLDDAAVLACMAYVDLNPIRAGLAVDLPGSPHTSAQRRLAAPTPVDRKTPLEPVAGTVAHAAMPATLAEYLDLADWTGRIARPGKRGTIDAAAPPVLGRLGLREDQWQIRATGIEQRYWRAVGAVEALIDRARAMGQCWLKGSGQGAAKQVRMVD
jgi:REP element-mobilizing transposase RayT